MKEINFAPDLLKKVLDGTKTHTRRPWKGPSKYKRWDTVLLHGTGKSIRINSVKLTRLHTDMALLSSHSACWEGWDRFYADTEYAWENNPIVWVYEFELTRSIKMVKENRTKKEALTAAKNWAHSCFERGQTVGKLKTNHSSITFVVDGSEHTFSFDPEVKYKIGDRCQCWEGDEDSYNIHSPIFTVCCVDSHNFPGFLGMHGITYYFQNYKKVEENTDAEKKLARISEWFSSAEHRLCNCCNDCCKCDTLVRKYNLGVFSDLCKLEDK